MLVIERVLIPVLVPALDNSKATAIYDWFLFGLVPVPMLIIERLLIPVPVPTWNNFEATAI